MTKELGEMTAKEVSDFFAEHPSDAKRRQAREQALIEAAKKMLLVKGVWTLLPETARGLREALTPYADCPPCCMSPELCAGTGRCPRDPVCNS